MNTLSSTRAPFARVLGAVLSSEAGLGMVRLTARISLEILPYRVDPSDSDRVLIRTGLLAVEGDLRLASAGEQGRLVGALRHLAPALPLVQGLDRQRAELQLSLDLGEAQVAALARLEGDLTGKLVLRGVCEHGCNPLFDEDGYQRMRVGDSGLSRALQAMGQTERVPLAAHELEIPWSLAERVALGQG